MPPAANKIHSLINLLEQDLDIPWIVLAVGIHRNDNLTGRRAQPRRESGRLSEVSPKLDDHDSVVFSLQLSQNFERLICAPVIHKNNFMRASGFIKDREQVLC